MLLPLVAFAVAAFGLPNVGSFIAVFLLLRMSLFQFGYGYSYGVDWETATVSPLLKIFLRAERTSLYSWDW